VNEDGEILPGGNMHQISAAGFCIHSAIHKARPDVNAVAHCHTPYGKAFSALGIEFDMITQDSVRFYKDHVVYRDFAGAVLAKEEGIRIAKALGSKSAAILQNHGLLTTGQTVDAAAFLFGAMEKVCQVQLLADNAAKVRGIETIKIREEEAESTHRLQTETVRYLSFQPSYEEIVAECKGDFL